KFKILDDAGRMLTQAETRRRPTAAEASFVRARDLTCRFPGCRRPATRCDDEHCRDHAKGGCSNRTNIAKLCKRHHTCKHEQGLEYEITLSGTVIWYYPDGRLFLVSPEGLAKDMGTDLDNAKPQHPTDQIIPRTRLKPGNTRPTSAI